jgi:hypothetical protein
VILELRPQHISAKAWIGAIGLMVLAIVLWWAGLATGWLTPLETANEPSLPTPLQTIPFVVLLIWFVWLMVWRTFGADVLKIYPATLQLSRRLGLFRWDRRFPTTEIQLWLYKASDAASRTRLEVWHGSRSLLLEYTSTVSSEVSDVAERLSSATGQPLRTRIEPDPSRGVGP